jgi:hypothetical protein
MSVALFARLVAPMTEITCFPHTPILYQNVLKNRG